MKNFGFIDEIYDASSDVIFTKGMIALYDCDELLKRSFNLKEKNGRICYAAWLVTNSEKLFGLSIETHALNYDCFRLSCTHMTIIDSAYDIQLPTVFYTTWLTREDLRNTFDIYTSEGRAALCGHLILYNDFVKSNINLFGDYLSEIDLESQLPMFFFAMWLTREDLRSAFDIQTNLGKAQLCGNLILYNDFVKSNISVFSNYINSIDINTNLPLFLYAIWLEREDINTAFNIELENDKEKLYCWYNENGIEELSLNFSANELCKDQNIIFGSNRQQCKEVRSLKEGVNLVGYPYSPSGLGQDIRLTAKLLKEKNIPFGVLPTPIESPSPLSILDLKEYEITAPLYKITIFCLPCSELYKVIVYFGSDFFVEQYLIGKMPWELSRWPSSQTNILECIDEAWTLSDFVTDSLKGSFSKPIETMPLPIAVSDLNVYTKDDFDIPEDSYAFLFTYDGLSTSTRKNPQAVINAFKKAFPLKTEKVFLVIKTQNGKFDAFLKEIYLLSESDNRIIVIDSELSRSALLGLFSVCDCYISLHRAEGFGLTIAEAMVLGKPVIISNYSGNTDFCNAENSFLINGHCIPLKEGDYFDFEGQEWFEANINEAVFAMQYCYLNQEKAKEKGLKAKETIENNLNVKVISNKATIRINSILTEHKIRIG